MVEEPMPARAIGAGAVAPAAVGTVVLALGDSVAAGIGASHVSAGCMGVLAVALRVRSPQLALVNLAVPGESSASMLAPGGQLDRAEELIADVAGSGGRVGPLALSIGGNDMMEAALLGDDEALRQFDENLAVIAARLDAAMRAAGSALAQVGCIQTIYNPFEPHAVDGGSNGADADRMAPRRATRGGYNRVIRLHAAGAGLRVVEVASRFRGRAGELTWVRSGDIHPTDEGHALIAAAYLALCAEV